MENLIHFSVYQAVSFTIAGSLFLFMFVSVVSWFMTELKKESDHQKPL